VEKVEARNLLKSLKNNYLRAVTGKIASKGARKGLPSVLHLWIRSLIRTDVWPGRLHIDLSVSVNGRTLYLVKLRCLAEISFHIEAE